MRFRLVEMPTRSDYRETLISILHLVASINDEFRDKYKTLIEAAKDKTKIDVHHIKGGYKPADTTHKVPNDQSIQNTALVIKGNSHKQTMDAHRLPPERGISFLELFKYLTAAKDELEAYQAELMKISDTTSEE